MRKDVRVLVVDDSALFRRILERNLNEYPGITVVGAAADPYIARDMIVELRPDVLTLDIVMPRMDGIAFLRKLMKGYPMPVVVVSAWGEEDSPVMLDALSAGAVDVFKKPGYTVPVEKTCSRIAALIRKMPTVEVFAREWRLSETRPVPRTGSELSRTRRRDVIALGASTGGVEVLQRVLSKMPSDSPGIVVVQHMPAHFTPSFSMRLDSLCAMSVKEAVDGDSVIPGQILIAPGDRHMSVERAGSGYRISLNSDAKVKYHRPSVDVMFQSVARSVGSRAVGAIFTGMGNDGAEGLLAMREAGAITLAQDEESSVVYGMPKTAAEIGAANYIIPLENMTAKILECVYL